MNVQEKISSQVTTDTIVRYTTGKLWSSLCGFSDTNVPVSGAQ
jgi:monothiol glutaredoxin